MRKFLFALIIILLLALSAAPVLAQRPAITVTPVWRPGEQLTTLTADSDFRYVDVELQINSNVQFWAVNISCTFTPGVLQEYPHDEYGTDTPGDPGDDVPMVRWGPEWGVQNTDFVPVSTSGNGFDFAPGTGRLTMTATRLGNVTPLGINGANYNLLLATVRLRVRDLGTSLINTTAVIACSPREFLNRDGRPVAAARMARTAPLKVRTGYQIRGQVLLQSGANHINTEVTCTELAGPTPYVANTTSAGIFSFGSSAVIRDFGQYQCTFVSRLNDPQAEFLDGSIDLFLNSPTHFLLPVVLKGGNVDIDPVGTANEVDLDDLVAMTAGWSPGAVPVAYDGLDINGDRKVDRADLSILAGNYAPGAAGDADNPIDSSHMLFGLATDFGGTFPNSHILWGDSAAGPVQQLIRVRSERDFWPAMSPDGETVAFIRIPNRSTTHVLFTSPAATSRPSQVTPRQGFGREAFAPAWSPDGQRIAFICPVPNPGVSGYEYNEGDVCVIDVNGANLQVIATHSKIFPPAWFNDNVIIYAGLDNHPDTACRETLCFVDLANNVSGQVSTNLVFGADIVDMPAISSFDDDSDPATPNQPVIFYRYDNATQKVLRAAHIDYDSSTQVFTVPVVGATHVTAATPSVAANDIDFYDVSPFMNLVYYESTITTTLAGDVFLTTDVFYNSHFLGTFGGGWGTAEDHRVDGFVGNPTITAGFNAGQAWTGNPAEATLMHAERATMQWIP